MAVHAICPSIRCRKILTFADDVRGTNVTCRYCDMHFRVPQVRRPVESPSGPRSASAAAAADVARPSPKFAS